MHKFIIFLKAAADLGSWMIIFQQMPLLNLFDDERKYCYLSKKFYLPKIITTDDLLFYAVYSWENSSLALYKAIYLFVVILIFILYISYFIEILDEMLCGKGE